MHIYAFLTLFCSHLTHCPPTSSLTHSLTHSLAHTHRWYYSILVFTTLYIIFEDDIKRAALPPAADLPLEVFITVLLVFFVLDMGEWARTCMDVRMPNCVCSSRLKTRCAVLPTLCARALQNLPISHASAAVSCIYRSIWAHLAILLLAGQQPCHRCCKPKIKTSYVYKATKLPALQPTPRAAVSCIVRPGYFLGFYFWLDAIATVSLVFEVPSVKSTIMGVNTQPLYLQVNHCLFIYLYTV